MYLSIIVPVYNEEKNIHLLYQEITQVLSSFSFKYEIIYVNDGSTDNSLYEIRKLSLKDKRVIGIKFKRNFQKSAALKAGFNHAKGEYIMTLDGDLQDNPKEIPRFIEKIKEYDMVVGWKFRRKDIITKVIMSRIFNGLIRFLFGIKIHDNDCNYRIFKREIVEHLDLYGGLYRYIPVFAHNKGYKVGELKVRHLPRRHGKSKYGFGRLFTGAFDLLTLKFLLKYKNSPLHFFGYLGGSFFTLGTFIGAYLTFIKFVYQQHIGNRPLLLFAVLLILIGVQLISLGLIGDIVRSNSNSKDYII